MLDLHGKNSLVIGIANDQSIAWGVAKALHGAGARSAVTFLDDKAEPHVRPLAESIGAEVILPLNVEDDVQLDALFEQLATKWGRLDILVHSIAFAPRDDLHGRLVDASRGGFARAMDVSVHSFIRLVKRAEPLMSDGGCCLTMSFYGAQKVIGSYHLMGPVKAALEATVRELASELGARNVTVNALSPGTIATRAASGLEDFDAMLSEAAERSPLHRLATIEDVGACAVFLASSAARNVTGSIIYVDAGYHIMG
jgi:enoyl-[acyl-carrier protein] reductase I